MARCSLDKLRFYFELAQNRWRREAAAEDIRALRILRTAIGSVIDRKGQSAYKAFERELMVALDDAEQNPDENCQKLAERLIAKGATRIYGRNSPNHH